MGYREEYERWLTSPVFDEETKRELRGLPEEEIEDRFYRSLTFGTGGLRGVLGAGTNRMNLYTVGKATQGLADYINSATENGSAVIAYDSRRMSAEFALDTALILAANGIKAYLFGSLRPTPELSFAVRYLHATAGVVITASHNPPQYNGYKVYWSDGGQIVPPYDREIIERVNAISDFGAIKRTDEESAERAGLLVRIGQEVDDAYMAELKKLVLDPAVIARQAKKLKIVYTPLHGTGNVPVRRILSELGFEKVWVVPEQAMPDGDFPTLVYPNPEDKRAFEYALRLAAETDADIVLATDPDADRLGVYAKDSRTGEYMPFTGNMSGLLIAEYELSRRRELGLLPADPRDGALVTTIVSSKMAYDVAREYGLTVIEVLTGFKYIGEQIKLFEAARAKNGGKTDRSVYAYQYEFGYEESYECLIGTHARDKDAVAAVMALCEAAAYYAEKGLTLWDQMIRIYEKYGYTVEDLSSIEAKGGDGAKRISAAMEKLRKFPPETLGGSRVLAVRDYQAGFRRTAAGETEPVRLPKSNVLYFELENNGWCCVRPSGTEPKIKFYFGARGKTRADAERSVAAIRDDLLRLAKDKE